VALRFESSLHLSLRGHDREGRGKENPQRVIGRDMLKHDRDRNEDSASSFSPHLVVNCVEQS
jgi:hypothetical protein